MYTTLISTSELAQHLDNPQWAIVDCRFLLDNPDRGRRDYLQDHVPGAVYAHLDEDLSSPIIPGKTGRHPLPNPDALAKTLGNWGIGPGVQVVAYDYNTGGIATRLWWLLRWLGHDAVAVLDGGWQRWADQNLPTRQGEEGRSPATFSPQLRPERVVDADVVMVRRNDPDYRVVDSRSAERYRGETEPIDPVAGHIPGAVSLPYPDNLDEQGLFRPAPELRARFEAVLGDIPPSQAIFYCGSGVTAAHNLLAMAHAGLGDGRLYAGAWSEWITDPQRPVARGEGRP